MAEANDKSSESQSDALVDLSALEGLNFGPNWTEKKQKSPADRKDRPRPSGKRSEGGGPRDRRQGGKAESATGAGGQRGPGGARTYQREDGRPPRRGPDRGRGPVREEFKPVVEVTFYPDDIPFKALCHAMRTSCRTYELFEIARLILDKPERFIAVVRPLSKDEEAPKLFCAVPDGLPFLTEDAAISHVLKNHLEPFFEIEEVEVEAPKGNFTVISKCGITGELLGPPNYHRYQALVQEHHATRLPHMPFGRFQTKIESVKEQEHIDAWVQKMTKIKRYKIKEPAEGDPEFIDGLDALRSFLLNRRRDLVVRANEQARIPGRLLDGLPKGDLRRSVETVLEQQRTFPLETSNNLRGRLRRMRFTIYKRGSKGVSFVCAVKRNFREPGTILADSPQSLLEFIEKNANIPVGQLPEKFLGIQPEEKITAPRERAPDIEEVPVEQAEAIVEQHEIERQKRLAAQAETNDDMASADTAGQPASAANQSISTESSPPGEKDAPAVADATAEPPADPKAETDTKDEPKASPQPATDPGKPAIEDTRIRRMMTDLRWLVSEGYVVEFGDGKLLAVPYAQVGKADQPEHNNDESIPESVDPDATADHSSGKPQS